MQIALRGAASLDLTRCGVQTQLGWLFWQGSSLSCLVRPGASLSLKKRRLSGLGRRLKVHILLRVSMEESEVGG